MGAWVPPWRCLETVFVVPPCRDHSSTWAYSAWCGPMNSAWAPDLCLDSYVVGQDKSRAAQVAVGEGRLFVNRAVHDDHSGNRRGGHEAGTRAGGQVGGVPSVARRRHRTISRSGPNGLAGAPSTGRQGLAGASRCTAPAAADAVSL